MLLHWSELGPIKAKQNSPALGSGTSRGIFALKNTSQHAAKSCPWAEKLIALIIQTTVSDTLLFVETCACTSISQLTEALLLLIIGSSAVWRTGKGSILSAALNPILGL